MTIGWKLSDQTRATLIAAHPPHYANVVADHVTLSVAGTEPPRYITGATIIGRTDDDQGVEAMVVEIEGCINRPDGKIWHITWSLADGRTARESNDAIAELGWVPVPHQQVPLIAACW